MEVAEVDLAGVDAGAAGVISASLGGSGGGDPDSASDPAPVQPTTQDTSSHRFIIAPSCPIPSPQVGWAP